MLGIFKRRKRLKQIGGMVEQMTTEQQRYNYDQVQEMQQQLNALCNHLGVYIYRDNAYKVAERPGFASSSLGQVGQAASQAVQKAGK